MISLKQYIVNNTRLDSVCMIRLTYNETSWDYNNWSINDSNLFFFDEDMRVGHILSNNNPIKEIDETHIIYSPDKHKMGLEFFYGGAIL